MALIAKLKGTSEAYHTTARSTLETVVNEGKLIAGGGETADSTWKDAPMKDLKKLLRKCFDAESAFVRSGDERQKLLDKIENAKALDII